MRRAPAQLSPSQLHNVPVAGHLHSKHFHCREAPLFARLGRGCDGGVVLITGAIHASHLHAAVEQFMNISGSYWSRRTRSSASYTTAALPLDWLHAIERPTENLTARNVNLVSRSITNVASQFAIPVTTGQTINCRSQAMQAQR